MSAPERRRYLSCDRSHDRVDTCSERRCRTSASGRTLPLLTPTTPTPTLLGPTPEVRLPYRLRLRTPSDANHTRSRSLPIPAALRPPPLSHLLDHSSSDTVYHPPEVGVSPQTQSKRHPTSDDTPSRTWSALDPDPTPSKNPDPTNPTSRSEDRPTRNRLCRTSVGCRSVFTPTH